MTLFLLPSSKDFVYSVISMSNKKASYRWQPTVSV